LRWSALLLLLLAEGLALSVSYDASTFAGASSGAFNAVIRNAGVAVKLATVSLACFFLLAAARVRRGSGLAVAAAAAGHRYGPRLLAHLAAFGALAALTVALFGAAASAHAHALAAGWLLALALVLVTWLLALVPARSLPLLGRKLAGLLGASLGLGVVALAAGRLSDQLWLPLRRVTFVFSALVLRSFVHDAISEPETFTFGTPRFLVDIAPQCSGYEGMGLNLVFLSVALWFFRDRLRFPRAWALLPVGAAASFLVNGVRLVALVLVGTFVSPEIAEGGFHSYAGTLLFCAVGLSTVALALRSRALATPDGAGRAVAPARAPNPAAPYLVPFLVAMTGALLARAFSGGDHEPLSVVKPLLGVGALAAYWPIYRDASWRPTWRVSWFAPLAGLLVAALWAGLDAIGPSASPRVDASGGVATRALMTVLVVPLTEELAFRGFLSRRLSSAAFETVDPRAISTVGVAVSSAAFGVLHSRPVAGAVAGLVYALAYRARGRLADAIVAHAVTNAALVIAAYVTGGAVAGP
jgi:exosortase E/protease (VPEID-CTERM system)